MTKIVYLEQSVVVKNERVTWGSEFYSKFMIEVDDIRIFFYISPDGYLPSTSVRVVNEGRYDDEDHVIRLPAGEAFEDFDLFVESVVPERYVQDIKELWENEGVDHEIMYLTDLECLTQME